MDQILLLGIVRNAMWIVGLSVALAAASHASWLASVRGECLRREFGDMAFLVPASAGLLLVTVSLAWGASSAWERGLWIASSILLSLPLLDVLLQKRARH